MGELKGNVKPVRDHIELDKESVGALKQFISDVWIMRKAQQLHDKIPKGEYLINKIEMESHVDNALSILVKAID